MSTLTRATTDGVTFKESILTGVIESILNNTEYATYSLQNKTPYMYGAVGDGVADDTDAVQAMFDSENNYPVLADNFFGRFAFSVLGKINKFKITRTITCGRPIWVDMMGAEVIVSEAVTAFEFSMHNGIWNGGYINYTELSNDSITDSCIAIHLAKEVTPIMFMASTIRQLRVWGAHSGIVFDNPQTEIWVL